METKSVQPTTPSAVQPSAPPVDEVPSLAASLACEPQEPDATDATQPAPAPQPRPRRGFAAMDRAKVREIARRGGAASQLSGGAHRFTSEEAREAGRKGGRAHHRARGKQATA